MLGQSLPCPKCQGIIHVPSVPPATPVRPAPQVINSAALTKEGDPVWDEMLANESFLTPAESDTDTSSRFRPMEDAAPLATTFTPPTPLAPFDPSPALPLHQQNWQSGSVAKRRQLMVITTIAISSSLLALVGFMIFVRVVGSSGKTDVAQNPLKKPSLEQALPGSPDAALEKVPPQLPLNTDPTGVDTIADKPANSEPIIPETGDPKGNTMLPNGTETSTSEEPQNALSPLVSESPESPDAATESTADPKSPPDVSKESSQVPAGLDGPETSDDELPEFLRPLLDIINPNSAMSDAGFGSNQTETELDVQNADIDIDQVYHPPAKAVPSWEAKAAQSLSSFKIKDTSVLRCIDLFSKMTGVGITVDWQSCRIAGIDLTKRLDMEEKDKTIAELLALLAASNQLELSFDNLGLPKLTATRSAMEAKLPASWNIAELLTGPDSKPGDAQIAADLLIKLWGFGDRCVWNDGNLEWNDLATPIDKANLLASLCELSSIRKLSQDSSWHPSKHSGLLFSSSEWQRSSERLNKTIRMSTIVAERRPIPEILATAATEVDMNLVFDWEHVWPHGLVPNELAVAVLRGRTLPQVANRFANNYSIEIVPVASDTVWVTTGETRRKRIHVIPVSMPKDFKLEDLKQSLKLLAPLGPDDRSRFRVLPIPGLENMFYARICSPRADQIDDSDLVLSFGWNRE